MYLDFDDRSEVTFGIACNYHNAMGTSFSVIQSIGHFGDNYGSLWEWLLDPGERHFINRIRSQRQSEYEAHSYLRQMSVKLVRPLGDWFTLQEL